MRRVFLAIMICLIFNTVGLAESTDAIKVEFNGKVLHFDVQPVILEDKTMVPFRRLFEALEMDINWEESTKLITGQKEGLIIELTVGSDKALVNRKEITMDVPATIINGRTMVPVRFISEATGASVEWDGEINTVFVNQYEPLYCLQKIDGEDLKTAYINKKGKVVIYDKLGIGLDFSDGLAAFSHSREDYDGYINTNGEYVFNGKFATTNLFSEGLAAVRMVGKEKYDYINRKGEVVFQSDEYRSLGMSSKGPSEGLLPIPGKDTEFSEGLVAFVDNKGKCGYINKKGEQVIEPQYDYADSFCEGLAVVIKENHCGFVNHEGQLIIPTIYDRAREFSEGLASVMVNKKYGFINRSGEQVIPFQYDDAGNFNEGLACVKVNDKFGYINYNGEMRIPATFDNAYEFSEGLAPIQFNGKWGYINKKGEVVIEPKYGRVDVFNNGVAHVSIYSGGEEGEYYIDKEGNVIGKFDIIG